LRPDDDKQMCSVIGSDAGDPLSREQLAGLSPRVDHSWVGTLSGCVCFHQIWLIHRHYATETPAAARCPGGGAPSCQLGDGAALLAGGRRIRTDILDSRRAAYGEGIVSTLSRQLSAEFGSGYSRPNNFRMIKFAEFFVDGEIVSTASRQLSETLREPRFERAASALKRTALAAKQGGHGYL
jgi:hypothetical protein